MCSSRTFNLNTHFIPTDSTTKDTLLSYLQRHWAHCPLRHAQQQDLQFKHTSYTNWLNHEGHAAFLPAKTLSPQPPQTCAAAGPSCSAAPPASLQAHAAGSTSPAKIVRYGMDRIQGLVKKQKELFQPHFRHMLLDPQALQSLWQLVWIDTHEGLSAPLQAHAAGLTS